MWVHRYAKVINTILEQINRKENGEIDKLFVKDVYLKDINLT